MKKFVCLLMTLALMLAALIIPVSASADEITDLVTYQLTSQEMSHFNMFYTQSKTESDVLANCLDSLLTNDSTGALIPCAAKSYSSEDGVLYNKEKTELIMCPEGKAGSVSIPDGVTSIAEYAFDDCSLLTSIPLPDSLLSVDTAAFMGCSSLQEIELPVGVTEIPIFAFESCTSLSSFTVGKYIEKIGTWAFLGCSSLANLDLGYGVTEIEEQAFSGCSSLTTVEIPETINTIGRYTFKKCTSLTSVTFNVGLTSFGERLFEDCSSLTDITFLGTMDEWNAIEKGEHWYRNSGVTMVKCTNGNILLF